MNGNYHPHTYSDINLEKNLLVILLTFSLCPCYFRALIKNREVISNFKENLMYLNDITGAKLYWYYFLSMSRLFKVVKYWCVKRQGSQFKKERGESVIH